jgi:hypothetical protein
MSQSNVCVEVNAKKSKCIVKPRRRNAKKYYDATRTNTLLENVANQNVWEYH